MCSTARLKEPNECDEQELREFESLVRLGFAGSDHGLPARIATAKWLAFQSTVSGQVVAIAGLKQPKAEYTTETFAMAKSCAHPSEFGLELGWVFVIPSHQGCGIASRLCACLIKRILTSCIFATTRPDNEPMIRILNTLHFRREGEPFFRRTEDLALFLRPSHE